jgi:hypothetical protein
VRAGLLPPPGRRGDCQNAGLAARGPSQMSPDNGRGAVTLPGRALALLPRRPSRMNTPIVAETTARACNQTYSLMPATA